MRTNQKLTDESMDRIVELILCGFTLTSIAESFGVAISTLVEYLGKDADRSARAREARTQAAAVWIDDAENDIKNASDPFELAKAKELAHHKRWKAAKIAPKIFGDKLDIEQKADVTIKVVNFGTSDDEE